MEFGWGAAAASFNRNERSYDTERPPLTPAPGGPTLGRRG